MFNLEVLNGLLAAVGLVAVFGCLNAMNGATDLAIRLALVTLGAGLAGEAAASWLPERWQLVCDTVLFGGVVAFAVATRRAARWVRPELMPRLALAIVTATWLVFFIGIEP